MGIDNIQQFRIDLRRFEELIKREVVKLAQAITRDLIWGIAFRTPTDEGKARANWQVTLNAPAEDIIDGPQFDHDNPNPPPVTEVTVRAEAAIRAMKFGESLWISNNSPQINLIEFGGFRPANPGPSKDDRPWRTDIVFISGGRYTAAPKGMVGITVAEVQTKYAN